MDCDTLNEGAGEIIGVEFNSSSKLCFLLLIGIDSLHKKACFN